MNNESRTSKGSPHEQKTHAAPRQKWPLQEAQMKIPPIASKIGQEAVIVVGGAILAALLMRQAPGLKRWIKDAWN